MKYQWTDAPPDTDGNFFYDGPLPNSNETVVAIVQIFVVPKTGERMACLMIPPGWRGDSGRETPTVHFGLIEKWVGRWAGPEYGLCNVIA